jgi:hypothetical protein
MGIIGRADARRARRLSDSRQCRWGPSYIGSFHTWRGHHWNVPQLGRGFRLIDRREQPPTIAPNCPRQYLLRGLLAGKPVIMGLPRIAAGLLRLTYGAQPVGGPHRETIEGVPHGFRYSFDALEDRHQRQVPGS